MINICLPKEFCMKKTLYQLLGVAPDASDADISAAYARYQATLEAGPYDRNAQIIAKEAYAVLSHAGKRAQYDAALAPAPAPAAAAPVAARRPAFDWRHGV